MSTSSSYTYLPPREAEAEEPHFSLFNDWDWDLVKSSSTSTSTSILNSKNSMNRVSISSSTYTTSSSNSELSIKCIGRADTPDPGTESLEEAFSNFDLSAFPTYASSDIHLSRARYPPCETYIAGLLDPAAYVKGEGEGASMSVVELDDMELDDEEGEGEEFVDIEEEGFLETPTPSTPVTPCIPSTPIPSSTSKPTAIPTIRTIPLLAFQPNFSSASSFASCSPCPSPSPSPSHEIPPLNLNLHVLNTPGTPTKLTFLTHDDNDNNENDDHQHEISIIDSLILYDPTDLAIFNPSCISTSPSTMTNQTQETRMRLRDIFCEHGLDLSDVRVFEDLETACRAARVVFIWEGEGE